MFKKLIAAAALVAVASGAQATISGEEVTASDFGDQWPLTVDSGRIDCIHPMAAVFVHDETTYQLNGVASNLGYDSINRLHNSPHHSV